MKKAFLLYCFVVFSALDALAGPSISISSPANGATVSIGGSFVVQTMPVANGSPIANVQFYLDNWIWKTEVTATPFQATLKGLAAGTHTIIARATDASGAQATTQITVIAQNSAPAVSVSSPLNGATVPSGVDLSVQAAAHDADGDSTIAKVEFWSEGFVYLGFATAAPYQVTYKNVPAGTHQITTKVTDNTGLTGWGAIVNITAANIAPTITFSSPANNAHVPMDTDLLVQTTVHDPNGDSTIKNVTFYHDGSDWMGAPATTPFQATFSKVPEGTHVIRAVASDTGGLATQAEITVIADLPALRPDLIPTSVFYSNGVFGVTVKNQGTLAVPAGTTVTVQFAADATNLLTASSNAGIPIGGSLVIRSSTLTTKLTYGSHTISANVDYANTITELNETNNTLSKTYTLAAQPDLYISSFSYSKGLFNANVVNRGDESVAAGTSVRVAYYINGVFKAYGAITTGIVQGSSASVSSSTGTGAITLAPGTYTMLATVDDENTIAESDETNNSLTRSLAPPDAPVAVSPFPGNGLVSVSFTEPSPLNMAGGTYTISQGSSITNFTVRASNGSEASGTSSPLIVTGLSNGVAYTFTVIATNSMGTTTSATSAAVTPAVPTVVAPLKATRPAQNTGHGFFVTGGKLYDANGIQFNIRGVNRNHWDDSAAGIAPSNANTERVVIDFTKSAAYNMAIINAITVNHIVPIVGNWGGTCQSDPSYLTAIVDTWVAQAATWTPLNNTMILNIANEWGPSSSVVWHDSYATAIQRLRIAGYTGLISITSGGCGQNVADLTTYAQDLLTNDPQQNIIFDFHVYGGTTSANIKAEFDALKATGLTIMAGEFGPGRDVGPSPTLVTPGEVITEADSHGFGWLAWSWDDHLAAGNDQNYWFAMSNDLTTQKYTESSDLTIFGKDVVENPVYGLKVKAVKQTDY